MSETTFSLLMKYKELNPNSLSKLIGISQQATRLIVNGESTPKIDVVKTLLDIFPELNANWLITGRGAMFIQANETLLQPTYAKEPATAYKTGSNMDLQERIVFLQKSITDKEKLIALYEKRISELEARLSAYEGNGHEKKSAGL